MIENKQIMELEKHPEVKELLQDLLGEVQTILGDQFYGFYLYGSLATGDFNPYRSDVDFAVVTQSELPDEVIDELEAMHVHLASSANKWAPKLEGAYLPLKMLQRHLRNDRPIPTISEGRFYRAPLGIDWVIQRHVLREYEATLAGPSLQDLIDPVDERVVQGAIRVILEEWWEPMIHDPIRLEAPEYQPFAVLSMCRMLHTLQYGGTISKSAAANWGLVALDPEWTDLIAHALAWRRGEPIESIQRTVEFMRYAIDRSKIIEK